jgi:hypothetical protein
VRPPRTGTPLLIPLFLSLLGAPLLADGLELLPDVSAHLSAIRYAPADRDFQWSGWLGGGAGLLRWGRATLAGTADVETIIGDEDRAFDANQANYHLAAGVRIRVGTLSVYPLVFHESRHLVDRPKSAAVDWNMVGARLIGPLPRGLRVKGAFQLGVAHQFERAFVDYEWELVAATHAAVVPWDRGELFLEADARIVTTTNRAPYHRDGFVDFTGAAGVRVNREGRTFDVFVAYEHRNDVFLMVPDVRDRALFAMRIGVGRLVDFPASP